MKYNIYAGLGGSFGGASFEGIYEFTSIEEAERAAYNMAFEEYESYGGMHGLLDWDGVREDLEESGFLDDTISENEIEDIINNRYIEWVESWLDYYVEEVEDLSNDLGPDIEHDTYNDDDADCYCE
jgi:hypothetical protein